ncbi:DNA recombinase [Lactiplantibacillus plantarum]|nr:DNA recombinase [Lactiplantibacillus plantarum]KZV02949.1 putative integrase/recombinase plasmid associated [Lactiplantibacillus plantarum]OEZ36618.1 DNA recombinase [Lactiplantibacillus plantarum]WBB05501.1 DNA recombinase [Lactiplantibacillus plantarum]
MQQIVLPIKDSNVLKEVQDTLLHNFKAGRRNYIFIQNSKGVTYV